MRKHCYLQVFNRLKEFTLWEFCEIWCNLASLPFLQRDILMHRWRYPSLSLHGIEGAFSASGAKTVIPRKVIGKFSIRLVPNMTPEEVTKHVCWDALFSKQQTLDFLCVLEKFPDFWSSSVYFATVFHVLHLSSDIEGVGIVVLISSFSLLTWRQLRNESWFNCRALALPPEHIPKCKSLT